MTSDYGSPAKLFIAKRKGRPRQGLDYRHFAIVAEAIRFAGKSFLQSARSAHGRSSETSASTARIHRLYESNDYPCDAEHVNAMSFDAGVAARCIILSRNA
jgi:hypothetical protein